ncbi:MAG: TIGR00725 family protein [Deltaproteobacteria bacterium]|nr:MAG: TIGR00725 family protein [Deltaproteobacteria bacterium]
MDKKTHIGIIGAGECSPYIYNQASELGHLIGKNGWVLFCGGLGGVMEGAAKGCYQSGGITVGILPGKEKDSANPFITLPIATGLGEGRNLLVVRASDVVVAIAGGYGTLSEIGFALKIGKPVIGLQTWPGIDGIDYVETPKQAINIVAKYLSSLK